MSKKKPDVDIHKFALRIPEKLFKVIEQFADDSRDSINTKIGDFLVYGITEFFTKYGKDPDRGEAILEDLRDGRTYAEFDYYGEKIFSRLSKEEQDDLFFKILEAFIDYDRFRP